MMYVGMVAPPSGLAGRAPRRHGRKRAQCCLVADRDWSVSDRVRSSRGLEHTAAEGGRVVASIPALDNRPGVPDGANVSVTPMSLLAVSRTDFAPSIR